MGLNYVTLLMVFSAKKFFGGGSGFIFEHYLFFTNAIIHLQNFFYEKSSRRPELILRCLEIMFMLLPAYLVPFAARRQKYSRKMLHVEFV